MDRSTAQDLIDTYCDDVPLEDAVERLMRSTLTEADLVLDGTNDQVREIQDRINECLYGMAAGDKMKTDAERIARTADGEDLDWMDRLDDDIDVAFVPPHLSPSRPRSSVTIYTFKDGSRIIVAGAAWDYGVHATRLEDPETLSRYEYSYLERAWVGAGYGLTQEDAHPV